MAQPLEQRVAFITGGAGGIGLQVALDLGRSGARLAVSDRPGPALDGAVASLQAQGLEVMAMAAAG